MTDHPGIVPALVAFQAALPTVGKTSQAQYGKYADLSDVAGIVLPRLAQHGLCYTAHPDFLIDIAQWALRAELRHTSGEVIAALWPLSLAGPQQMGSQITYARRYCLLAMCGVHPQGEDDDAQSAQDEHAKLAKDTVKAPRKATRSKTTRDQDDEWSTDLPPVTHTPPKKSAEPTDAQRKRMYATLKDLGVTDHDQQHHIMRAVVGHGIESGSELTRSETTAILDTLYRVQRSQDPAAGIAWLLARPEVAAPRLDPGGSPPDDHLTLHTDNGDDQDFEPRPITDIDTGGRT
jgi:ERF superfamily